MDDPPTNVEPPPEEWSPFRWALSVWTWIFFLAAIAVLEITADPLLASLVLCVKLGGPDFWAALRLMGDSNSRRGVVLAYFCFGLSFLKIGAAGVVVTAGVLIYEWLVGWALPFRYMAGLLLLIIGMFLGTCAIIGGAIKTHEHDVRPWLDRTIYPRIFSRRESLRCDGTRNRIPWLLFAGMILVSAMLAPPILALVERGQRQPINMFAINAMASALGLLWLWTTWQLIRAWRYIANDPAECWGEQPVQSQRDLPAFGP